MERTSEGTFEKKGERRRKRLPKCKPKWKYAIFSSFRKAKNSNPKIPKSEVAVSERMEPEYDEE